MTDHRLLLILCVLGHFRLKRLSKRRVYSQDERVPCFEKLASFDGGKWDQLKQSAKSNRVWAVFGFDRDMGAIRLSQDNANAQELAT